MSQDAQAVDYQALLEDERDQLVAKLTEIGFNARGGVSAGALDYDSNFADTSQVTAERGEAEALASQLRDTLEQVETAIGKLQDGTYGTCEGCGRAIDPARLEAKPAARLCIDCVGKNR